MPQMNQHDNRFPIPVNEVVLSGLFGNKGIFKRFTKADTEKAEYWLEFAGVKEFTKKNSVACLEENANAPCFAEHLSATPIC